MVGRAKLEEKKSSDVRTDGNRVHRVHYLSVHHSRALCLVKKSVCVLLVPFHLILNFVSKSFFLDMSAALP